jgi:RNA polymerase sigma-70 factor (ECF subfamily)
MFSDADSTERAVLQWQAGIDSEEHFRQLFERYYAPVRNFFIRRGLSSDRSRDLTQDTFVRVYHSIGQFRREVPFEAWLFHIAANVYRNALRSASARKRTAELVAWDGISDPAGRVDVECDAPDRSRPLDAVLQNERRRILRDAITDLPPQMRRCLVLRVYQDLTYEEIAFVLHVSIDTVKAHLFQARRQLRTTVASYFGPV